MVQKVAIIGAGIAGLFAMRHMSKYPTEFKLTAFEQTSTVGGTWVYTKKTDVDDYGLPVHSSMYKKLCTNLPKQVMEFEDFPFSDQLPSFMSREDVLDHIHNYCNKYQLHNYIKFNTYVTGVEPIQNSCNKTEWNVEYCCLRKGGTVISEKFDAVLVCNGNYAVPYIPDIEGLNSFQGLMVHSHSYREPDVFTDMQVVVLGDSFSGPDIAIQIAEKAKTVTLSYKSREVKVTSPSNLHVVPQIKQICGNGLICVNGERISSDAIVFCTGYRYSFPFLRENCRLNVTSDFRVAPLYKHIFHIDFPTLMFIGIVRRLPSIPARERQVLYCIAVLRGKVSLPDREEMERDIDSDFDDRRKIGMPGHYAHVFNEDLAKKYLNFIDDELQQQHLPDTFWNILVHSNSERAADFASFRKYNYFLQDDKCFAKVKNYTIDI